MGKFFLTVSLLAWCCGIGLGEPAAREKESRLLPSIPVRILLDEGGTTTRVDGEKPGIYVPGAEPGNWTKAEKNHAVVAVIRTADGSALSLDGKPQRDRSVVLRAGPEGEDRLRIGKKSYTGALRFTLREGHLVIVNAVPLETYVVGTVGKEMSRDWESEALKAQAVASRSYAYYAVRHPRDPLYDVEGTIHDQVYDGLGPRSARIRDAVEDTSGQYLTESSSSTKGLPPPIKAFFHSRCGGTTDSPETVWKGAPSSPNDGAPCAYCRQASHGWSTEVPVEEVRRIAGLPGEGSTLALEAARRSSSGRLAVIRVSSGEKAKQMNADRFRRLVGYQRLPSSNFSWEVGQKVVRFTGKGAGHGVGMCQWGARQMAREGKAYQEILSHFYPNTRLYVPIPRLSSVPKALWQR